MALNGNVSPTVSIPLTVSVQRLEHRKRVLHNAADKGGTSFAGRLKAVVLGRVGGAE